MKRMSGVLRILLIGFMKLLWKRLISFRDVQGYNLFHRFHENLR